MQLDVHRHPFSWFLRHTASRQPPSQTAIGREVHSSRMPAVLICAPDPLFDELHGTLLWRTGIERHVASRFEDALTIAVAARPELIAIDCDMPQAERLIENLRGDPITRQVSIVVLARGEFESGELRFLEAGANAILRMPPGPEWDERLGPLMQVPVRRRARIPVCLQFEAKQTGRIGTAHGLILNISLTGMLVETSHALEVGDDVDFSFRLTESAPPVVGCAQVVRVAGNVRYGMRYYGLEGDAGERVRRFVEE